MHSQKSKDTVHAEGKPVKHEFGTDEGHCFKTEGLYVFCKI